MSSNTISARIKSVLENRLAFVLIGFSIWGAGVMSGSVALMVLSSLAVFALPFVYGAALAAQETKPQSSKVGDMATSRSKRVSLTGTGYQGA